VQHADLYLSVLTLGEIRKGIEQPRNRDPGQAEVFASWLGDLHKRFTQRIPSIDERVADEWGCLNAVMPRKPVDRLIAATARVHDLTVATRNTSDFEACDVKLINPWTHQPDA